MGMLLSGRLRRFVLVGLVFGLVAVTRPAAILAQDAAIQWHGSLEHLSATAEFGWEGPAGMSRHSLSADGRWTVFTVDVASGPLPPFKQVFKRDRLYGTLEALFGTPAVAPPAISPDGGQIAVEMCDGSLRADGAAVCDVYVLNGLYSSLVNASTAPDGTESDAASSEPVISRDGRFLVFRTNATTLLPAGAAPGQLVLRDRDADGNGFFDEFGGVTIHVVSVSSGGEPGNAPSGFAEVSGDGRFVAFRSRASNLVPDDTNDASDVFLHDRQSGETRRLNVGWDGQQATPIVDSAAISMTDDGNLVAFAADDEYLMNPPRAEAEDNGALDVLVYDRQAGTLQRIDIGVNGTMGNGHTYWPTFSADGRYLSMVSAATNIEEPSTVTPGRVHAYVYDRSTAQVTRVSRTPAGAEPNADAAYPAITADGSFVTFVSRATNIPPSSAAIDTIYGAGYLNATPTALVIPAGGGTVTLDITAQQYVQWSAELSDHSWLSAATPLWGTGSGSVTLSAFSNPSPAARSVSVQVGAQTIVVTQAPDLSLHSVSPSSGPTAGGTPVTLSGTGFGADVTVYFGSEPVPFEFVDSTTIRAVTPPQPAGSVSVSVHTTEGGVALLESAFSYRDTTPPEVYASVWGDQRENGWYTSDVYISWAVYDPHSEVTASPGCGQTFVRTDTKGTLFSCSATSEGGTTTKEVYIQRDATPPVAHIAAPQNTLYPLNSVQIAYPMCFDDTSGVASCLGSVRFGQPFDTSTPGHHTYSLLAVDEAGWGAQTTNVYAVSNGECDPRPSALLAWWPGDGDFRDVIGARDGVLAESQLPEFLPGMSRAAMYFRIGDGKGIQIGDAPALRMTEGLTLSAWTTNWAGTQNAISVIAGKEGEYLLGRHYDGRIHYALANTSPGWGWVDTSVATEWNVWTHIALTYDGTWIRLYKNGDLAYSAQGGGSIGDADPNLNDFRIGVRQGAPATSEFGGGIDDLQLAGRALSGAEIMHAFLSTPHGQCPEPGTLEFAPDSLRARYGQASAELVAQLTRSGVPQPGTPVYFKFRGLVLGATETDGLGLARMTVALPDGWPANTYADAVEARVDADLVLTASTIAADFVVEKATPVVTWSTPLPIVYGAALNGLQLNARANAPGQFQYSPAFGSVLPAGSQILSATFGPYEPNNYNIATAAVTLVVAQATPIVTVYGGTFGYDGTPKQAGGFVQGIDNTYPGLGPLTFTYDGSSEPPVNAGTYTVVGSYAGDSNYSPASGTATLTIEQATPTLTLTGGTFVYDGAPHAATAAVNGVSGEAPGALTLTYNGSSDAPVNGGTYTVVATFAGDANYAAATRTATLTITKASPRITAAGGTFTYDGLPHPVVASLTGVDGLALGPLAFLYSGSPDVPVNAGSYTVVVSYAGSENYEATFTPAAVIIQRAPATVIAFGGTFTYDGLPHAATGAATGVGGATLGPLTFTYNGSSAVPVNAGAYAVVAGFAGDANHDAASGTATVTIGKATPALSATGGTFIYDGSPRDVTVTATGVGGAAVGPLTFIYDGTPNVPVNVGSYGVVISFNGNENYTAVFTTASIMILKGVATVTATGGAFTYDGTPHEATAAVTGADGAVLGPLTFTYSGSSDAPVNAGQYGVVASFAGDANHDAATATATLTIGRATPEVIANGGTFTYDGTAHAATGSAAGVGGAALEPPTFTYNGSPNVPVNAGAYEVIATYGGAANYEPASVSATLTIEKAAPVVTVSGGTFTYDGSPHPAAGSALDGGGGDMGPLTFTYNGSTAVPVNAGEYAVVGAFEGSVNYSSASATATITIAKAPAVIDWRAPASIVYGTALGATELNASAVVPGTFSYTPGAGSVLFAGANQVLSVTFAPSDGGNYSAASTSTTITVMPAPLVIRAEDAVKRFGAPLPALTGTVAGFVNGDSLASLGGVLVFSTPATAQSPAGVYPIVATGVSSPNYSVTFVDGTLTVVRGAVTVGVTTSPEPSGFDQPMTFTATVAAADAVPASLTGLVRFFDGATPLGTAAVDGNTASLSTAGLSSGTRTIWARYDGDGSFEPGAVSSPHVVRSALQTPVLALTSSRNPSNVGQTVTIYAEVDLDSGDVSGTVQFYSGATLLGASLIRDERATLTTSSLPVGSHAITARYVGSGSVPPSRSGVLVQAVGENTWKDRWTTLTLSSNGSPSALGATVVFTATVAGSSFTNPTGRILVMVDGEPVGDPSGVVVTPVSGLSARMSLSVPGLAHGRHTVTATYLGDPLYRGSTAQIAQSVN